MSELNDKLSPSISTIDESGPANFFTTGYSQLCRLRPLPELLLFFRVEILDVKDFMRLVAASLAQKFLVERLDGRVHV